MKKRVFILLLSFLFMATTTIAEWSEPYYDTIYVSTAFKRKDEQPPYNELDEDIRLYYFVAAVNKYQNEQTIEEFLSTLDVERIYFADIVNEGSQYTLMFLDELHLKTYTVADGTISSMAMLITCPVHHITYEWKLNPINIYSPDSSFASPKNHQTDERITDKNVRKCLTADHQFNSKIKSALIQSLQVAMVATQPNLIGNWVAKISATLSTYKTLSYYIWKLRPPHDRFNNEYTQWALIIAKDATGKRINGISFFMNPPLVADLFESPYFDTSVPLPEYRRLIANLVFPDTLIMDGFPTMFFINAH